MILREFSLDASDMDRGTRRRFSLETRCVTSLYEQCFGRKFQGGPCWKILADVVGCVERAGPVDLLGVFSIEVEGNVPGFFTLSDEEKKRRTARYLSDAVRRVATDRGWDWSPFELAFEEMERRAFRNERVVSKRRFSPDRKHYAEVSLKIDLYKADIALKVKTKTGDVVLSRKIVSTPPSEFLFVPYLGKLSWLGNGLVELLDKEGREVATVDVS